MALRQWLAAAAGGMAGAALVILGGLLWNLSSNGGLIRVLGGSTSAAPSDGLAKHAGGSASTGWQAYDGGDGYTTSCDYRFHLLIPPDKSAQMSIDLSRYAGEAAFLYPTVVKKHFLQAQIAEAGETIAVDVNDADGDNCGHGHAVLSDLPKMCFDIKVEQRCY